MSDENAKEVACGDHNLEKAEWMRGNCWKPCCASCAKTHSCGAPQAENKVKPIAGMIKDEMANLLTQHAECAELRAKYEILTSALSDSGDSDFSQVLKPFKQAFALALTSWEKYNKLQEDVLMVTQEIQARSQQVQTCISQLQAGPQNPIRVLEDAAKCHGEVRSFLESPGTNYDKYKERLWTTKQDLEAAFQSLFGRKAFPTDRSAEREDGMSLHLKSLAQQTEKLLQDKTHVMQQDMQKQLAAAQKDWSREQDIKEKTEWKRWKDQFENVQRNIKEAITNVLDMVNNRFTAQCSEIEQKTGKYKGLFQRVVADKKRVQEELANTQKQLQQYASDVGSLKQLEERIKHAQEEAQKSDERRDAAAKKELDQAVNDRLNHEKIQKDIQDLTHHLNQVKSETERQTQERDDVAKKLNELTTQYKDLIQQQTKLTQQVDPLKLELALNMKESNRLKALLTDLNNQQQQADVQLKEARQACDQQVTKQQQVENNIKALQTKEAELQQRTREVRREKLLQLAKDCTDKHQTLIHKYTEAELKVDDAYEQTAKIAAVYNQFIKLNAIVTAKRKQLETVTINLSTQAERIERSQKLLSELQPRIEGLRHEYINSIDLYEARRDMLKNTCRKLEPLITAHTSTLQNLQTEVANNEVTIKEQVHNLATIKEEEGKTKNSLSVSQGQLAETKTKLQKLETIRQRMLTMTRGRVSSYISTASTINNSVGIFTGRILRHMEFLRSHIKVLQQWARTNKEHKVANRKLIDRFSRQIQDVYVRITHNQQQSTASLKRLHERVNVLVSSCHKAALFKQSIKSRIKCIKTRAMTLHQENLIMQTEATTRLRQFKEMLAMAFAIHNSKRFALCVWGDKPEQPKKGQATPAPRKGVQLKLSEETCNTLCAILCNIFPSYLGCLRLKHQLLKFPMLGDSAKMLALKARRLVKLDFTGSTRPPCFT